MLQPCRYQCPARGWRTARASDPCWQNGWYVGHMADEPRLPSGWPLQQHARYLLPHLSCRHFCFQSHTCVGFLRVAHLLSLTRCIGLGWDGVSAFALRNANGCWWVSGRESTCPPQPTLGRDIPCTYLACMLQGAEQNSELTLILPL